MAKKSWTEKLHDSKGLPKVDKITEKMSKKWGQGTFVIPAPIEVDAFMKKVPWGKLVTINGIREALARKHKTTIACPITTGLFACIAAKAAEEQRMKGVKDTTAYWRTLKTKGVLNPKYPGGVEGLTVHLKDEGHLVVEKGKTHKVLDYEKKLVVL